MLHPRIIALFDLVVIWFNPILVRSRSPIFVVNEHSKNIEKRCLINLLAREHSLVYICGVYVLVKWINKLTDMTLLCRFGTAAFQPFDTKATILKAKCWFTLVPELRPPARNVVIGRRKPKNLLEMENASKNLLTTLLYTIPECGDWLIRLNYIIDFGIADWKVILISLAAPRAFARIKMRYFLWKLDL